MKKLKLYGVWLNDEGVGIAVAYNSRQAKSIFYREIGGTYCNDTIFKDYYAQEIKPNEKGEFETYCEGDCEIKNYKEELSRFTNPGIF